jgi:hypothetical protein
VEVEVLFLQNTNIKAFSVTAFLTLTLGPIDAQRGGSASPITTSGAHLSTPPALANVVAPPPTSAPSACPADMILVEGDYCPDAEYTCLKWLDPPPYENLRCGEFGKPSKCKGQRQHRRFCVDRDEYAEPSPTSDPKDALPVVRKSWTEAKALCESRGARLCKEAEWEFACEGPDMSPYPYGWKRDSSACNIDRTDLGGPGDKLIDHRAKLGEFPACVSPFGVHDMTGNVDEWVEREGLSAPNRSALRGGWWLPGRNRCRAATREHAEDYSAKQVGFRCCKDP